MTELSDVLDSVAVYIGRYVWFQSEHQLHAVTLWIVATYLVLYLDVVGMLHIGSPTRECGKSLLLDILEQLCWRPKASVNMSNAVLFRYAADGYTLLFDEVDNLFARGGDEDQRSLLNAAYRRGRTASRMAGPPAAMKVQEFDVFCPIRLQRKPKGMPRQRFRLRVVKASGEADQLRSRIEAAVAPLAEEIAAAWPELPDQLGDRQQDVWEPLIAIADAAGNGWEKWSREAALALHSSADETDGSVGIRLLADCRVVFDGADRLATATLLERLHGLEEAPWVDWYGKPINARFLADKLRPFNVSPTTVRIGDQTLRGYTRAAFHEPWERYLPATDATDATTRTGQADPAEMGNETGRNTDATASHVAEPLHMVAETEAAETVDAATDVAPVAHVSVVSADQIEGGAL